MIGRGLGSEGRAGCPSWIMVGETLHAQLPMFLTVVQFCGTIMNSFSLLCGGKLSEQHGSEEADFNSDKTDKLTASPNMAKSRDVYPWSSRTTLLHVLHYSLLNHT